MTLGVRCGFEPGADDPRLWGHNSNNAFLTGVSAPTTTTSALSPSDARRWMKIDDTGSQLIICRISSFGPDNFVWYVQRDMVIEGTIPGGYAADYLGFQSDGPGADRVVMQVIRGSATNKFKLTLRTRLAGGGSLVATTSSEFTTATKYHLRLQMDGTNWTLWVDGTEEAEGANTAQINDREIILRFPTASSTVEHYWAGGVICESDDENDRPSSDDAEVTDIEVDTGGSESEAGWGDDGDCDASSTTAEIADVAMDGSDQVNGFIFWCENAGDTDAETVDTVTKTFTSGHTIGGAYWRGVVAASLASKTVTAAARIYNGSVGVNITLANIASDTLFSRHVYFPSGPAAAWTQSAVDSLKIGMINQGGSSNGANTECAAIIFTLCGLGNDPPPGPVFSTAVPYAVIIG